MPPEPVQLLDPPVNRAAYSDRSAWIMARCSELAYVPFEDGSPQEQQLRNSLKDLRLELCAPFRRESTTGYVAKNQRYAVLAFRGTTKDLRDIVTDIKIRFYRDKEGVEIATGFGEAFTLVEGEVRKTVGNLDPSLPLYITGHSLGGALAVIASTRIRPSDRIAACYTFGCPRVGNTEFAEQLWKVPVYRQVHASDIVPRLPFSFGYRHAGDLRYIKRSDKLIESPNSLGTFLAFAFTFATGGTKVFQYHKIAGYTENLRAWALTRLNLEKDSTSTRTTAPPKSLTASPGATP
ncbi:MAG TPA: lipase family protein [Candidatus Udaeobacter sp.]|nr:lipase family protein [Candidatus Udaeobacter sp.]